MKVKDGVVPVVVPETMMVMAAHPDDELLSCGGTIMKYGALGTRVTVVVATPGLGGYARREYEENIADKRQREFERLSAALDCNFVELGWEDCSPTRAAVAQVTNLVRDLRPQVLLVPHHADVHRVHRNFSWVCREAVYHCATGKAYGGEGREFLPLGVYMYESPSCKFQYVDADVFVVVDISEQWPEKRRLFAEIYASQVEVVERARAWAEATATLRGSEIEGTHGEAFVPLTEYVPLRIALV
ncbi:MAG: PIG-L family deacetylase [Promethearchaeota archaeon]